MVTSLFNKNFILTKKKRNGLLYIKMKLVSKKSNAYATMLYANTATFFDHAIFWVRKERIPDKYPSSITYIVHFVEGAKFQQRI